MVENLEVAITADDLEVGWNTQQRVGGIVGWVRIMELVEDRVVQNELAKGLPNS